MRIVPLGEVVKIERKGISPEKIKSGENFVGLENINSSGQFVAVQQVSPGDIASTKFQFTENHVLYGKLRPYLKKIARPSFSGVCSTDIVPIKVGEELDKNYLFHFLRQSEMIKYAVVRCSGANLPRLSPKELEKFKIPLPPLKEQKRIATILDKADAIRRKRQQAIDLTDQLLRSVFLDMFGNPVTNPKGWATISLEEISDIQSGITKGRKVKKQNHTEIPYMRVANVQDGHIKLGDVATIAINKDEKERYKLMKNDILLTEGGDPDKLGRGAVWQAEIEPCIHQNHIFRVRIKEGAAFAPHYLSTLIGSQYGKRYFLKAAKQTTGIATINKTQLKEFPVLVPPLDIQNKFEKHVEKYSLYTGQYEKLLNRQNELFQSLTQRAFRVELSKQTEVA